SNSSTVKNSK
ncbi:hypothetical protein QLX08_000242, partial [Tetragonisca angustula]